VSGSGGLVPGESAEARAAALAGALAELGVTRLVLRSGRGEAVLAARRCDLPGLLAGVGVGTLVVDEPAMRFDVRADRIEWWAARPGAPLRAWLA